MSRRLSALAAAALLLAAWAAPAAAQTTPNWAYGYVPTQAEWNTLWASKQDYQGAPPCITTGCTMTGALVTVASSAASSGFNLPPGTAPTAPNNGDFWSTSLGFFGRVNGATVGPLTQGTSGSFTGTSPIVASFPGGGVVNYACATCGVTGSPLSQFASTTSAQLAGIISNETGTGLLVFNNGATFIAPALGVATGTSLALGGATLGSNALAVTGSAAISGTLAVTGASTLTGLVGIGAANTGTYGNLAVTGSGYIGIAAISTSGAIGIVAANANTEVRMGTLSAHPLRFYTNTADRGGISSTGAWDIGVMNVGTSLALGGCTIGSNVLCATGSAAFSSTLTSAAHTITSASTTALAVGLNGSTNPAFQVDASNASQVAGVKITGVPTGGTVLITAIDSGISTNISLVAKGFGNVVIGAALNTQVQVTPPLLLGAATLANGQLQFATISSGAAATIATVGYTSPLNIDASTVTIGSLSFGVTKIYNGGVAPTGTGIYVLNINPSVNGLSDFGTTSLSTLNVSGTSRHLGNVAIGANVAADAFLTINANTAATVAPPTGTNLHLVGADGATNAIDMDGYGTGILFNARYAGGTLAAKTAVVNAATLFSQIAQGWDGANYVNGANIQYAATENWVAGANRGTSIVFRATAIGASAPSTVMTIGAGVAIGNSGIAADTLQTISANTAAANTALNLGQLLHIVGADGVQAGMTVDAYGNTPQNIFRRSGGTNAAPTAVPALTSVLAFNANPYNGTNYATQAQILARTFNLQSGTDRSTQFLFLTTPVGSTTMAAGVAMQPSGGLSVGATSIATDPGIGSLNLDGSLNIGGTFLLQNATVSSSINTVDVSQNWPGGANPANVMASFSSYSDVARFIIRGANGSIASPAAVVSGGGIGALQFRGYPTGGWALAGNAAQIQAVATDNFTSTTQGTSLSFQNILTGSITVQVSLKLWGSGGVSVLANTDPGAGIFGVNGSSTISGGLSVGTTQTPVTGQIYINNTLYLIRNKSSFTSGAGASTATLTNSPSAGNPTKWIPIDDNGTTRYIPAW